jgi:hypothetical protein
VRYLQAHVQGSVSRVFGRKGLAPSMVKHRRKRPYGWIALAITVYAACGWSIAYAMQGRP